MKALGRKEILRQAIHLNFGRFMRVQLVLIHQPECPLMR